MNCITIQITNHSPVCLDPREWPVIAIGEATDVFQKKGRGAAIVLRRHATGRTVAEAAYVEYGQEGVVSGTLGDPSVEGHEDFLPLQIRAVGRLLSNAVGGKSPIIEAAVRNALASLPPVELK